MLSPFKDNGKLKLIMVMILIPFFLNAINFWLIDNILKLKADPNEDELKEIYANEEKINDHDDNPFPHYIQIDFDKFNKNESNIGNQLEIKQISSDNTEIERNK
jgi:hypothetical protein